MSTGVLIRGLLAGGAVRAIVVEAHAPADEARVRHDLSPTAARLTAQAMVAAAMLSAHLKGDEQITLQIQGSRPRLGIYVDHTAEGALRARTSPPHLGPAQIDGRDGIAGALLAVKSVRDREVYRGITEIDGSIEHALSQHLGDSAQVDAVLRIHVEVSTDGAVVAASGLLLERLAPEPGQPSIDAESFNASYAFVKQADAAALMTELAFGSIQGERLDVLESHPLRWQCRCSDGKVRATLASLGAHELAEMIAEDGGAEVTCHFCNQSYRFDEDQLRAILAGVTASTESEGDLPS